jgi:hyperosmotically inducible periplasmic protein
MRRLIGAVLGVILIALLGFMLLGYWAGSTRSTAQQPTASPVGSSGGFATEKARERAAAVGEKAAIAAETVRETVSEAGLTAKIKAKMALDDHVKALAIDVTTVGTIVTLSGRVGSAAERDRAMALARETDGVTRVVDNLQIAK